MTTKTRLDNCATQSKLRNLILRLEVWQCSLVFVLVVSASNFLEAKPSGIQVTTSHIIGVGEVNDDLARANKLAIRGEYAEAIEILQIKKLSRSRRAKVSSGLLLSQIHLMQDQPEKALNELNQISRFQRHLNGFDESAFHFLKPIAHYDAGRHDEAKALLKSWESSNVFKYWRQYIDVGKMYYELGEYDNAARMFEKAIQDLEQRGKTPDDELLKHLKMSKERSMDMRKELQRGHTTTPVPQA